MRLTPPLAVKRRRCFLRVQGRGRRFSGSCLRLLVAPGRGLPRVGYTVSGRVGNAVVRNRLRRRLKEIVRGSPSCLQPYTDYVIIGLPTAAAQSFAVLRRELLCLFQRAARRRPPWQPGDCSPSLAPTA